MAELLIKGTKIAEKIGTETTVDVNNVNANKLKLTPSSAPSSPVQGDIYLDSSDNQLKIYSGTFWKNILSGQGITAIGGTITDITDGGVNYRVHTFTSSENFTVLGGSGEVEYLVVAGGGGGSATGAGAGGYRCSVVGENSGGGVSAESKLFVTSQSYTVIVGAGGSGGANGQINDGYNGSPSQFSSIIAFGGAGGRNSGDPQLNNGLSGASGSGGYAGGNGVNNGSVALGGNRTVGQGFAGGNSAPKASGTSSTGGGGGAGAVGGTASAVNTAGNGGAGVTSSIDGTSTPRAGGGGGGIYTNGTSSSGGIGGGGNGSTGNSPGSSGSQNTGGGAGGAYSVSYTTASYSGGSGIVIIRYPI